MSPRPFVAVVTALLLLAGAAPTAALAGVSPGSSDGGAVAEANALPHNGSLGPGEVEMRIDVAADGDARWRVKTVVPIEEGDQQAFEDLVREFNRTESPLGLDAFRAAASNASEATGRSMEIRNVERHHASHNETGALWITFTWTDFGRTSGGRLSIDDGFNTSSGVWLPSLSRNETLVVVPPSGYGVSSAPTGSSSAPSSLSNGVARWDGPRDFDQRGPWIVYSGDAPTPMQPSTAASPNGTAPPDGGTGTGTSPGGPGGDGDGLLSGALPLLVLVVLAGASAAVLAVYMRGDDDGVGGLIGSGGGDGGSSAENGSEPAPERGAGTDATDGAGAAVENGSEPGDAASTGAGAAGATAVGAGAADGADGSAAAGDGDQIDEELLSDEERVERLIERNGGRMKQAAIVRETGWSNAKVSQLLSAMDDDGRIDKLRIGRENLISFPDEDVADLDSE